MIPSFSTFRGQLAQQVYTQSQQAAQILRMCDGQPGDKNPLPGAISMPGSQGTLDAVVISNPDQSQTMVQRQSNAQGQSVITWLDLPATNGKANEPSGFEIPVPAPIMGAPGAVLEAFTDYGNSASSFLLSERKYKTRDMSWDEAQNARLRAEAVLAAFKPA